MKKYVIYIGILIVGLLLGWLFFGSSSNKETEHDHSEMTTKNQLWTCSMHPQIMQPEAGDCPICGMDLIPAEVGADGLSPNEFKLTKNAMALADIQTSVVGNSTIKGNIIKLSGKISENEDANLVQASYFSGRIERLNISAVGEQVRKGQLLATIYSPELFSAQQELITASSLKESQPELYKAVRNKLKLWKISDNQISQIESSGKVVQNFPVYATVSGTVSEKLVEQGDYVKQGQALLKITNLSTVWALFDVYENQIELFKKGQNITVTTNAYPNREFKRKVDFIDPMMNPQTRTVALRVVLNNRKGEFKTGMFIEGEIENTHSQSEQKLTIPASAVLWTGERSVVYIKTSPNEPVFEMRQVTLGKQLSEKYEVIDGLNNGDEVVTNGAFTVDASAQLQGKKSMMNKEGGKTTTGHEGHTGMKNSSTNNSKEMNMSFTADFQKEFGAVLSSYLKMKDALVSSNVSKVIKNANDAYNEIKKLRTSELGDIEKARINKSLEILEAIAKKENLKKQRDHFVVLNENLVAIISNLKTENTLYVQQCPMADNNKGAFWISTEEHIRNPYFGDEMLECGSIIRKIGK